MKRIMAIMVGVVVSMGVMTTPAQAAPSIKASISTNSIGQVDGPTHRTGSWQWGPVTPH